MNLKTIFKRLVLLDLLILILIFVAAFNESELVVAFNESINPPNDKDGILGIIAILAIALYFLNLYLLYKFKNIGKQMYLFLFIFMSIFSLLLGTNAYDPIFYLLDGLGWAISGAILVLLYFSPIKKEFEK
tara:strand:- start:301 stop:693 length:393 start_codon:yes stop_codon:yes gene_type:complete